MKDSITKPLNPLSAAKSEFHVINSSTAEQNVRLSQTECCNQGKGLKNGEICPLSKVDAALYNNMVCLNEAQTIQKQLTAALKSDARSVQQYQLSRETQETKPIPPHQTLFSAASCSPCTQSKQNQQFLITDPSRLIEKMVQELFLRQMVLGQNFSKFG